MKLATLAKAVLAGSVLMSASVFAADAPVTVTGSTAFTTNYLFRGVSQTMTNAAVQGSMTFTHTSGAYFSMWGSSIASGAGGLELDTLLGYSGKAGEVSYDVGVMRYNYPGINDPLAYDEIYGSVSMSGAKIGLNISPDYFNKSDKFTYLYASYGTEVAGFGVSGSLGMNKFDSAAMMTQALGTTGSDDSYMDYKLAVSKTLGGVGVEGAYIGSDIDEKDCGNSLCEGTFVLTLSKGF
ncbi:MAG TPA: TorF family putative porin [Fluviicoccus sp.]|nr:TorF family putative porin [Fluviicoccus sp.]